MAPRRKSAAQTARKRRPPSNQQQPSATPPQPAASSNGTGAWSPASAPIDYNLLLNDPIWFESSSYANVPSSSGAPPPEHALVGLGEAEAGASPAAPLEAQAGQLVRRNPDSHLMRRPIDPWEAPAEQDALIAPPESPASRKPIPPFVQKLCSFLDDPNNEHVIRWSDDGESFVVVDEDEFAKTLIPGRFKHNNYASFVRQLNMYGFHKVVGLSDNSLRASENNSKPPSIYKNKNFQRGRPDLLELVQKPEKLTGKRKRDDDTARLGDSDEDGHGHAASGAGTRAHAEDGIEARGADTISIPRSEYQSLRQEVRSLQRQQDVISDVLTRMRQHNDHLYKQATSFKALHDRHEQSINAILAFLASVFKRSLENQGGNGPNLTDMFSPAIGQSAPNRGDVVDIGDALSQSLGQHVPAQRARRSMYLLPPPDSKSSTDWNLEPTAVDRSTRPRVRSTADSAPQQAAMAPTASPAQTGSAPRNDPSGAHGALTAGPGGNRVAPPATDAATSANEIIPALQGYCANEDGRLHDAVPDLDLSSMPQYQPADSSVPNASSMTTQQRNAVLSFFDKTTRAMSANGAPTLAPAESSDVLFHSLQRLSAEQNYRVQNLQEKVQPFSPSGRVPGMADDTGYFNPAFGAYGEPSGLDLNAGLPFDGYEASAAPGAFDANAGLGFDGYRSSGELAGAAEDAADASEDEAMFTDAGDRVQSLSSTAVTSPAGVDNHDGVTAG